MTSRVSSPMRRERFADQPDAGQRRVLDLLLAQDGSTTRLCEAIAGGPVALHVVHQRVTGDVPELVRRQLPGDTFIERITFLAAHGEVLMDNLSFIALAGLAPDIEADLRAGQLPIGRLLARMWIRRETMPDGIDLAVKLWESVGMPDPSATRAYRIVTRDAPCMVIAETYRRGMLMDRPPA
jgi:chorismate-pyruvate lyase